MQAMAEGPIRVSAHPDAAAFVARAVERHGGADRWARLRLALEPARLTGLVPRIKGLGRTFRLPRFADIEPARARAVFHDYPEPGATAVFDAGRVALGDAAPAEHRATFRGVSKLRRWTPVDALYFFGYALTHYHALPFTLGDAQLRRWNARRRVLTVAFAATVHTHCTVQRFHFDESGLIVRHDYVTDIIGPWARGAHMWRDYVTIEGFPIATHRHVLARLGPWPTPLVALDAHLAVVHLTVG